jgi:hypothetical protein
MIFYLLISVIYCATFVAFLNTKKGDESYMDRYGDWHMKYILLCMLGTVIWPLVIPFLIFYKIAFKILNKTNKQK